VRAADGGVAAGVSVGRRTGEAGGLTFRSPVPIVSCGSGAGSVVVPGGVGAADGKKTERPATGVVAAPASARGGRVV